MNSAKQILLAGFAAGLSLFLSACSTTVTGPELAAASPLVVSPEPLVSASYVTEYTQDGALPFVCEVKLGTEGRIRRDYAWKDENGADKKVSVVINGRKAVKLEDGKASEVKDADTAMARFFAGLVMDPASVISSADQSVRNTRGAARYVYWVRLANVPGVESCIVNVDPKSRLWTGLQVRMEGGSGDVSTLFSEYKSDSGTTYPSLIVSSTENGAPVRCIIRDVKINPELPDELFLLPDING